MKGTSQFFLFWIGLMYGTIQVYAQTYIPGMPIVQYFGTNEYGAGIQNYEIFQDYRGIIYVANNLGLLEYDGKHWKKYNIEVGTKIRSAYADASGKIFIGAQNGIGYLGPGPNGTYEYTSLKPLIPEKYSNFDDIWNVFPYGEGYVFTGTEELFFYDGKFVEVLPLVDAIDFTFSINGRLITPFSSGIKYLEDGQWKDLQNGKFFKGMKISSIVPLKQGHHLFATEENGLYLVNGHEAIPWGSGLHSDFSEHKINTCLRLSSGIVAVGTNSNGLYLLDQEGQLVFHFSKDKGINNRSVLAIYEDSFGNIWLGLNNGIAKIEWQSPFRYLDEKIGLLGTGYAAYNAGDFIYLGTNNGLFYTDLASEKNVVQRIENVPDQVYSFQNVSGDILVGSHSGAFQLEGTRAMRISDEEGWWVFKETEIPDLCIGGNYDGIYLLKRENGNWTIVRQYQNFRESSRVMEFDDDGTLWMGHGYKGLYSFRFSDDYNELLEVQHFTQADGLPSNVLNNVFKVRGELAFTTEKGIYRYEKSTGTFRPNQSLNDIFGQQIHIRELVENSFGNIYFIANKTSGMLIRDSWGQYEVETSAFNKIHNLYNDDLEEIALINDNNVLFAVKDGFVHFKKSDSYLPDHSFNLLIREVRLTVSDSILFAGNFYDNGKVTSKQPTHEIVKLPYEHNSLSFQFAAVDFDQEPALFRYTLDGFGDHWSDWSTKTDKEYTNLQEGNYEFRVEAQDIYGNLSAITSFSFQIAPPWYRTKYALISYILLAIGSIVLSIALTRTRHVKERKKLIITQKKELNARDHQLQEVSRKSKEEINRLKNEKLKEEIRFKKKELATSTMHLIDKNDFISSIKNNLNDLVKTGSDREMHKQLKRIVREIDKNIDEDDVWDQFELHFDEVHEGFIKTIKRDYPTITPQEIKLCAYLRMNMSTKEIANLLRISVRGVEIARYRLRKKLQLDKDDNLVEFMMNYDNTSAQNAERHESKTYT